MPDAAPNVTQSGPPDGAPVPAPVPAPVLVAIDGTPPAGHAAAVAAAVAERRGAAVRAVSVVDARAVPIPPPVDVGIALADALLGPEAHAEQEQAVRAGLARALGRAVDWPVRVALGRPAAEIDAEAERAGAGLVVVGLARHGRLARVAQDETVVGLMRASRRPVLAATEALGGLPRRVLAAVDFTRASVGAAREALGLVAPGGVLTLAYVPPLPFYDPEDGEHRVHELGVEAAFDRLAGVLAGAPGALADVRVERVVVRRREPGPPTVALLAHAEATGADLLALGSRRHGRVERWLLGSTTADAARDGRVSVLAVPPEWSAAGGTPGGAPDLAVSTGRTPAVTY